MVLKKENVFLRTKIKKRGAQNTFARRACKIGHCPNISALRLSRRALMLGGKVKPQAASCKRFCLPREVSVFTAFFKGDVLTPFCDGLVAGADDLSSVCDLFHAVGRPARDT